MTEQEEKAVGAPGPCQPGLARRICGRVLTCLIWLFAVLCLLALVVGYIGVVGVFGVEPDPFASVFAILLAMPWFLLLDDLVADNNEFLTGGLMILAGMTINLCILFGLRRLVRRPMRAKR